MTEVAAIIGKAIGKSDLAYIHVPDTDVRGALLQFGLSHNVADLLLEMSRALNDGHMKPLESRSSQKSTPTSYETFVAQEFVPLFQQSSAAA